MASQEGENEVTVVRNATDLQRLKLEKLMKNPEKPAFIPDRPKDKKFSDPAEFVRNVMGSSAGAGSGEFHVYRHIRRREYARQEFLQHYKEKEDLDIEYHIKLEENRRAVEDKAAKKRAKRQRQKERQKAKRQKNAKTSKPPESSPSESSEEEEEEEKGEKEGGKTESDVINKEEERKAEKKTESNVMDRNQPQETSSEKEDEGKGEGRSKGKEEVKSERGK